MTLTRRGVLHTRDLLLELVVREMKLRYERSMLGMAWAVLNPLMQIAIFTFVFHSMMHLEIEHYPLFIFAGLLSWNWFREGVTASVGAITHNAELVRQPGFPIGVLPIVTVAIPLLDLLAALPVLFVFLLASGIRLTPAVLMLPVLIGLQFFLLLGIGFVLASIQVSFRDVQYLVGVTLLMLFYLTPVFYSLDIVPGATRVIYSLNPMTQLITAYRQILLNGVSPNVWALGAIAGIDIVLLQIGWVAFARARHAFVEQL